MANEKQKNKFRSCAKKNKGKPNYRKNMSACLRKWVKISSLIDPQLSRFEIEQSIFSLQNELRDIENRINQEPSAQIHKQMQLETMAKINNLQNQLSIIPISETVNPIQQKINKLQTQIQSLGTYPQVSIQQADRNINIRSDLQNQIDILTAKLKEPLNIIPNNKDQFGNLENPNTKGLLLAGGLLVAAIVLNK